MNLSLYSIIAGLVLNVLLLTGAFFEGRHYEAQQYAAAASAAKDQVIEKVQASDRIGETIAAKALAQVDQVRTLTQFITQEVPRYVTVEAVGRCTIPVGFVRLHDAAAAGQPPVPFAAGGVDAAAAGIDLATVGAVTAANYGVANENAVRLKALQDWLTAQQALGN